VASYVGEFAAWVREAVLRRDTDALTDYRAHAPCAARAHPADDHYLPLLIASGAARAAYSVHVIHGGVTYGLLSMDSYIWGVNSGGAAPSPIQ
jgi:4,5-DOPA dioxygenase extradiol